METLGNKKKLKFNETTIYKDLSDLSVFISNAYINMRSDFKSYTLECLKYIAETRALFRLSFTEEDKNKKVLYLKIGIKNISCAELFLENLYILKAFTLGQYNEITKLIAKIEIEFENFENYLNKN